MTLRAAVLSLAYCVGLLVGCNEQATGEPEVPTPGASAPKLTPVTLPEEVKLETVTAEQFKEKLAGYKGHVVIVDYWATWCIPCRKKFPKLVKLGKEHAKDGLLVVTVAVNDAEDELDIMTFLNEQKATVPNFRPSTGAGQETAEKFGLPGPVPFYQLYDIDGKLIASFSPDPEEGSGMLDPEELEAKAKAALEAAKGGAEEEDSAA